MTDDLAIASESNNFFVGIGPNLANRIPQVDTDCTAYLGLKLCKAFVWEPVTDIEIKNHILALDV